MLWISSQPRSPGLQAAVSHAQLSLSRQRQEPIIHLWRPSSALSLGRQDLRHPALERVCQQARDYGFSPVRRLVGGQCAVLSPETLVVSISEPIDKIVDGNESRYQRAINMAHQALRDLGVHVAIQEGDEEWCPGQWSLGHAQGKVAGFGQRICAGAAICEGVILIANRSRLVPILKMANRELGIPFDPGSIMTAEELVPDITASQVLQALRQQIDEASSKIPASVLSQAQTLASAQIVSAPTRRTSRSRWRNS